MLSRRLRPITAGLVAALLVGCNNARTPEPASGAPVAATQRVGPSDVALPEGVGCSGAIARYRAIMDNDRAMGHVNQGVYDKILRGDWRGPIRLCERSGRARDELDTREQSASRLSRIEGQFKKVRSFPDKALFLGKARHRPKAAKQCFRRVFRLSSKSTVMCETSDVY